MLIRMKSVLLGALVSSVIMLSGCLTDGGVEDANVVTKDPIVTDPVPSDLTQYDDQYKACPKVTSIITDQCNDKKGILRKEGMMGCYRCVVTYQDAGKTCQDATDCEGSCRAAQGEFAPAGTPNQTGQCQKSSSPFGCFQTIKNGVLQSALCVD